MLNLKNILVPIDFSVNSIKALEYGEHIAKQDDAVLHLMHVIDSSYFTKHKINKMNEDLVKSARIRNAEEELKKFVYEIPRNDIKVIEVLCEGVPHEEIIKYSINNFIDLIVISSHGWTNYSDLMLGGVSKKVFQLSEIPVVCIKANYSVSNRAKENKRIFTEKIT